MEYVNKEHYKIDRKPLKNLINYIKRIFEVVIVNGSKVKKYHSDRLYVVKYLDLNDQKVYYRVCEKTAIKFNFGVYTVNCMILPTYTNLITGRKLDEREVMIMKTIHLNDILENYPSRVINVNEIESRLNQRNQSKKL